jgi:hypothetical protein
MSLKQLANNNIYKNRNGMFIDIGLLLFGLVPGDGQMGNADHVLIVAAAFRFLVCVVFMLRKVAL